MKHICYSNRFVELLIYDMSDGSKGSLSNKRLVYFDTMILCGPNFAVSRERIQKLITCLNTALLNILTIPCGPKISENQA